MSFDRNFTTSLKRQMSILSLRSEAPSLPYLFFAMLFTGLYCVYFHFSDWLKTQQYSFA